MVNGNLLLEVVTVHQVRALDRALAVVDAPVAVVVEGLEEAIGLLLICVVEGEVVALHEVVLLDEAGIDYLLVVVLLGRLFAHLVVYRLRCIGARANTDIHGGMLATGGLSIVEGYPSNYVAAVLGKHSFILLGQGLPVYCYQLRLLLACVNCLRPIL